MMFQSLLKTLSHIGQKRLPIPFGISADAPVNAVVRFESLVGELHLASMQVAVVTSGVNALQAGMKLRNALSLQELGPSLPDAETITLPLTCRQELGIGLAKVAVVREFFRDLGPAQRDVEMFCRDAQKFGEEEAGFLDLPGLCDRWRVLSVRAFAAVAGLEADVVRCLPARYERNTRLLKQLLRAVIDGKHPCVGLDSIIKLPDLPQRRAAVRPNVNLRCAVEYQGMTFQAVAKDLSTSGVGLEEAPPLRPHTVVVLEFENGQWLAGLVVWSKGTRAGIKLDVPLSPGHPLLAH